MCSFRCSACRVSSRSKSLAKYAAHNHDPLQAINGLGGVKDDMDDDDKVADRQKTGVAYLYLVFGLMSVVCLVFLQTIPETKGGRPFDEPNAIYCFANPVT